MGTVMDEPATSAIERACQRLVHTVALAIDAHRFEDVALLFTADGSFQRVSGVWLRGREAIGEGLRRPSDFMTIHHASPTLVDVVGPTEARGATSFVAYAPAPAGQTEVRALAAAVWDDVFAKTTEGWRIAERRTRVL
jgi:uncharacterized protein (TIGR02246 family)